MTILFMLLLVVALLGASASDDERIFQYERTLDSGGLDFAWHPNNRWLAISAHRRYITVLDVDTNQRVVRLKRTEKRSGSVNKQVVFTDDGKYLVSVDDEQFDHDESAELRKPRLVGRVWNTKDWRLETKLLLPDATKFSQPAGLCLLPDDRHVAIAERSYLAIFNIETGEQTDRRSMLFPFPGKAVKFDLASFACSPNEDKIAFGGTFPLEVNGVRPDDSENPYSKPLVPFLVLDLDKDRMEKHTAHTDRIHLSYSGDGRFLVTEPRRGGQGTPPRGWHKAAPPPDGQMRWFIAQEPVYAWKTSNWEQRQSLPLPKKTFHGLESYHYIPDMAPVPGTSLHVICDGSNYRTVRLWDLRTGQSYGELTNLGYCTVRVSRDRKRLAVGTQDGIEIYRITLPAELKVDANR